MLLCIMRTLRIAFLAMVGALVFQIAKQSFFPAISMWESHLVTVLFFTLSAFFVSIVLSRREAACRSVLSHETEIRQKVEQQLHLKATALAAAANAIVITDREGKIVWVNPAFTRLTGYSAEEALGDKPRILKSDQHDPAFYDQMWQTILSGAVWRGEIFNRRKDGSLFLEEVTITPVRVTGEEISHFIAIKVDATERKRAKDDLLRSEAALRSLVENAPYGIFRSTPDGQILGGNPAICRMLGYASETELMSVNMASGVYRNPEERLQLVETLLKEGKFDGFESTWRCKNGSLIAIRLSAHASVDGNGDTVFEGFIEDITDHKRSTLELLRLNRALSTLSRCNEALVHATDEAQLLNQICEIVVQVGGYRLAWVGYAEHDESKTVRVMAKSGVDDGYIEKAQITWADSERGCGPTGTAIRTGEVCILRDMLRNPQFSPWRDEAVQQGYAASISLPLNDEGSQAHRCAQYLRP